MAWGAIGEACDTTQASPLLAVALHTNRFYLSILFGSTIFQSPECFYIRGILSVKYTLVKSEIKGQLVLSSGCSQPRHQMWSKRER